MARSRGSIVLAVLFTLLGFNAWAQVIDAIIGGGTGGAHLVGSLTTS